VNRYASHGGAREHFLRYQRTPSQAEDDVGGEAVSDIGKLAPSDPPGRLSPNVLRPEQRVDLTRVDGGLMCILFKDERACDLRAARDEALSEPKYTIETANVKNSHEIDRARMVQKKQPGNPA
jgi:hypothetical protein